MFSTWARQTQGNVTNQQICNTKILYLATNSGSTNWRTISHSCQCNVVDEIDRSFKSHIESGNNNTWSILLRKYAEDVFVLPASSLRFQKRQIFMKENRQFMYPSYADIYLSIKCAYVNEVTEKLRSMLRAILSCEPRTRNLVAAFCFRGPILKMVFKGSCSTQLMWLGENTVIERVRRSRVGKHKIHMIQNNRISMDKLHHRLVICTYGIHHKIRLSVETSLKYLELFTNYDCTVWI